MITLQITEEKAKKLDEVENIALDTIKSALNGGTDAGDDEVKVAVKMMGVVAKNRQTMTNRSAIEFAMATNIATEEQLKKYVLATSPQVQKALGK